MANIADIIRKHKIGKAEFSSGGAQASSSAIAAAVQPMRAVGEAIASLQPMFERMARPYHQADAQRAVSRDENGNVQFSPRFEFTVNDSAYNAAGMQKAVADGKTDIDNAMLSFRQRFQFDPVGFKQAAEGYKSSLLKNTENDLLRNSFDMEATSVGGQHFRGITQDKFRLDNQNQFESLSARRKMAMDELETLALTPGGLNTPEAEKAKLEYDDVTTALVDNPNFGFTREKAELDKNRLASSLSGNAVIGTTREYVSKFGPERAQRWLSEWFDNPENKMSAADRTTFRNKAQAEITAYTREQNAVKRELRAYSSDLIARFNNGETVDLLEVDDLLKQANDIGDYQTLSKLTKASAVYNLRSSLGGVSNPKDLAGAVGNVLQNITSFRSSGSIIPSDVFLNNAALFGIDLQGRSPVEIQQWQKDNPEQAARIEGKVFAERSRQYGDAEAGVVSLAVNQDQMREWLDSGRNNNVLPPDAQRTRERFLGASNMGAPPTGQVIYNGRPIIGQQSAYQIMQSFIGVNERDPVIRAFLEKCGGKKIDPAVTPWCAAFANAVLHASGIQGNGSFRAMDFLKYGEAVGLKDASEGDLVVFDRGGGRGHVGFFAGTVQKNGKTYIKVLGGNQSNSVTVQEFPMDNLAGFRRPPAPGYCPDFAQPVSYDLPDGGRQYNFPDAGMISAMQQEISTQIKPYFSTFENSIKNGRQIDQEEFEAFVDLVGVSGDQNLQNRLRSLLNTKKAGEDLMALPVHQRKAALERLEQQIATGGTFLQQEVYESLKAQSERSEKAWRDDPMQAAMTEQKTKLTPMDWTQESLAARSKHALDIQGSNGLSETISPLTKGEKGELIAIMSSDDGAMARTVLAQLSSVLPSEQMIAIMSDKDVVAAVKGMALSYNSDKMSAAFSVLDGEYRRDPIAFESQYGGDIETKLTLWQTKRRYMTAEALFADLRRADDPAMKARREEFRKTANKKTEKMTINDVVSEMNDSWFTRDRTLIPTSPQDANFSYKLLYDYKDLYADAFAETGDDQIAKELAKNRLSKVWGISSLKNGQLMEFPPERYVQPINGSHDWVKDQFERDIKVELQARAVGLGFEGEELSKNKYALNKSPVFLVPDDQTEIDVKNRSVPSYSVVVQMPNGQWEALTNPIGDILRWKPNFNEANMIEVAKLQASHEKRKAATIGLKQHFENLPQFPNLEAGTSDDIRN